ncbi:MAG: HEAT repeat domain-containing protein [Gemmataceae bacterium]|nr:HEAT repeat domain-containing protein [Gemmataceae bacterium]
MRPSVATVLMVLALAGCSRKAPPNPVAEASPVPIPRPSEEDPGDSEAGRGGAGTSYEGRTAPQWAKELENSDNHAKRSQASIALSRLGERGYPHLAAGMRSNSDEVRIACLQVIDKPTLLAHPNEMVPLLTQMLRDRQPMIRRSAAARLCWFGEGARGALRDLQQMASNDPETDIRQVARVTIELIQNPKAPHRKGEPGNRPPPAR